MRRRATLRQRRPTIGGPSPLYKSVAYPFAKSPHANTACGAPGSLRLKALLLYAEAAFEQREEQVGENGEHGGGNGSCENNGIADHGDPAKDESTQSAGADGRCNGGDSNSDYGRGADAREDDSQGKRQAHAGENLRVGHAHGFSGFQDCRIDTRKADVSIAENGKQRVEHERDDGGAMANAANERNGNQKSEQRQTGDGLEHTGDTQRYRAQSGALHDKHAKRHANDDGDGHGNQNEDHMIESGAENLRLVRDEKGPRRHVGTPGDVCSEEVKALTSG